MASDNASALLVAHRLLGSSPRRPEAGLKDRETSLVFSGSKG